MRRARILAMTAVVLSTLIGGSCGGNDAVKQPSGARQLTHPVIDAGDDGRYAPRLTPADFVDGVDNPYFPLPVGATWSYEGMENGRVERVHVRVLPERRQVMGISAVVVRDTVSIDGQLTEDTYDWYAQDRAGNVWYLGESTKEYEHGRVVSTAGSWEAGVAGAYPGIVMKASPRVGDAYRQEYFKGQAEDLAKIVQRGVAERVPAGEYRDLIVIEEWNPLAPKVVEQKYYTAGIGPVLEVVTRGGAGRVELIAVDM